MTIRTRKKSASLKKVDSATPRGGTVGAWHREGVESILVAIMLALLFRSFEAEAFVIPTGSMAPTLQGRHKDIQCPQCRYQYQAGASLDAEMGSGPVVQVTCPMCFYSLRPESNKRNHGSFSGDRILVNKFAYQFWDPDRWDVIVFKFPGNAKQNYIKRLVGLPNETIEIRHGDVYVSGAGQNESTIARKPPEKLKAMLQLVSDTQRIPEAFINSNWPSSWVDVPGGEKGWTASRDRQAYTLAPTAGERWLRYRHLPPSREDWPHLSRGNPVPNANTRTGELITDFYAYNGFKHYATQSDTPNGWHWVGDLALECKLEIQSTTGTIHLDLVEAGDHFRCDIDVASGTARLGIEGGSRFDTLGGQAPMELVAQTKVKGPGTYQIMFSNVDDQLRLWVGKSLATWTTGDQEHAGTYVSGTSRRPVWSETDPGDLMPLGLGGSDIGLSATDLRVWRDIYYVSAKSNNAPNDYESRVPLSFAQVRRVLADPRSWSSTDVFDARRTTIFALGEDQFFPMGDNSPQSRDARLWGGTASSLFFDKPILVDPYVESDMLIGKAFLVYWPHGWNLGNVPPPIIPNVGRMNRIR